MSNSDLFLQAFGGKSPDKDAARSGKSVSPDERARLFADAFKAEQERANLWNDFDSEVLLAEALEAQERARELQAAKELRQEIEVQVLITEIDQEVKQP